MADQKSAAPEREPRFVEELAGESDYWMTLTDAARVTRRQEVTIRRWVASGALPVRRQTVGLNQRTRHVRASDLARLTPIIDTAAAISGATAQVDLVSIPAQQAQILATHTVLHHDLAQLQMHLTQMETQGYQRNTEQDERQTHLQATLAAQQIELVTLRDAQVQLQQQLWDTHQALVEQIHALAGRVTTQQDEATQQTEMLASQLETFAKVITQGDALLQRQLDAYHQAWDERWEQEHQAWQNAHDEHGADVQAQLHVLTQLVHETLREQRQLHQDQDTHQQHVARLDGQLAALYGNIRHRYFGTPRRPHSPHRRWRR